MANSLPPLQSLQVFEAALRHESFARAGDELALTAGAVAYHVKRLEDWAEHSLFERRPNGILATERGKALGLELQVVFDRIRSVGQQAKTPQSASIVKVRSQFSVAARWLASRLPDLERALPGIELVIEARNHLGKRTLEDTDMLIEFTRGPLAGLRQEPLIGGRVIAVCGTSLSEKSRMATPIDLLRSPLLHTKLSDRGWHEVDWATWFAAAGIALPVQPPGHTFNLTHLTLEAAAAGAGVCLVTEALARDMLMMGRLVRVGGFSMPVAHVYHLIAREPSLARQPVRRVYEELLRHREVS